MARKASVLAILCPLLASLLVSCERGKPGVAPAETPIVPVSVPLERQVTDYVDFTGRTDAVKAVDVRARATGYIVQAPFKEGAEVKQGQLLFEIDPKPYEAQFNQVLSQVELNDASLRLARTTYDRDRTVATASAGAVSQQQLDQDKAAVEEAAARLRASKASTEVYKLNLGYTRVTSPIRGQVSRYYLTVGNLVNQDQTLLTTVVSLDPMFVYFDLDEPTLIKIRRAINEGKIQLPQNRLLPIYVGLQGDDGFPHKGVVDFINNQVNPTTGSISVRGLFANPDAIGESLNIASGLGACVESPIIGMIEWAAGMENRPAIGSRLLSPGMFVRVRFPIGLPHQELLVIDRAIQSDQGLKYVYVVDAESKVQYRRVTTGSLQEDGLRVISDGLKKDDLVVVGGLQLVRPKVEVRTEKLETMPSLARAANADLPVSKGKSADKRSSSKEK